MAPRDRIYNTLFYLKLMNGPIKLECYITIDWKTFAGDKHSNFICPFVSNEDNEVMCIHPLCFTVFHKIVRNFKIFRQDCKFVTAYCKS